MQVQSIVYSIAVNYFSIIFYLASAALVVSFVVSLSRSVSSVRAQKRGPIGFVVTVFVSAVWRTVMGAFRGIAEILTLPFGWRRTFAIAMLSFKEAIRNKILYVFAFFFLPFLFVGWYLPKAEEGQLLSLVAFVTMTTNWIMLLMALFTVSFSLPNDLKRQTVHTVVTKPVRRLELVTGRVVGFMGIFTIALLFMGAVSLVYLKGQLAEVELRAGLPFWKWRFNSPELEEQWTARVPIRAQSPSREIPPLLFVKQGSPSTTGRNVGKEWEYRSHIEGQSSDSASWHFLFAPGQFGDQEFATLELTFNIYKTTKGTPTYEGLEGSGVHCQLTFFDFHEDRRGDQLYSMTFRVDNNRRMTFDDVPTSVFKTGKLQVMAQCLTSSQFIGMAQDDLYFLAAEKSFEVNFYKGLVAIWLKVLLVTCIAVTASTVLNGFVTAFFTAGVYQFGYFYAFVHALITKDVPGGAAAESLYRLITQEKALELPPGTLTNFVLGVDKFLLNILGQVAHFIPNLTNLETVNLVAEGFDIAGPLLIRNVTLVLAYVVPLLIVGFFLIRSREIAA